MSSILKSFLMVLVLFLVNGCKEDKTPSTDCKAPFVINMDVRDIINNLFPTLLSKKREIRKLYLKPIFSFVKFLILYLIYNKKTEKKEGKHFYKLVSYYKGKLKNGKASGWGVEVLKYQSDKNEKN